MIVVYRFMAASKVLGEETIAGTNAASNTTPEARRNPGANGS
jgi:hypothetical protein